MIEWWLGRHSSSMRSGLCVELWAGAAEPKSQSVVSVQNACFNVEAVIEIEGFKVGPKRSHVALRNLRIERSKSRSSSSSSNSSEPFLPSDFELALVFDKPGQYTLPITDITRIRCKYLQQGKASLEAKGSLVLLTAVSQGDLERLLLFIRDVKTGKTPVESRSCVVCREKGHKVKHKREELQSSEISHTSKLDGDCQATKKQKIKVLDCIFRKRQLLHVSPGQDQVLKQLRDLKNRDHVHKSKKMGLASGESDDRPHVIDREVFEATSKFEDRFQDEMRQYGRENSGSRQSPPAFCSRGSEGQDSRSTSPTTSRIHVDERSRRVSEDERRRERPGSWSGRRREREIPSTEGEGKENFKGEDEVRKIGEETVRRLAEERKRAEEERRRVLEEQRRRVEEEHRRVQEEQRKRYEDERRRREEVRRSEEEERRQVEERERKSQDERRRREDKERQKEELRKLVEEQERKRKEEKDRRERERALEEERRRKEEEERVRQELKRQKQEEERLRKELERRVQEQEQLRKQEEERRRKEEEDQRLLEIIRQREEEERLRREQERRLQEQVLEVRRRQEEEKKKQEALRRQRQEEERQLLERRKQEELRRHQQLEEQSKRVSEDGRRQKQEAAAVKAQEDSKVRMLMEEERKKLEEIRRRVLDEQREKLEQRRLDEEMRQWQREEDHRRAKEDKWKMSDEERARLDEQRHRVEEVMKMTRDLARRRLEENVRQAQDEEFCRKYGDDDKRTLDEDIQKLVDKANNVASLEEILIKLKERCSFRNERDTSENGEKELLTSDHTKGMSYLLTRLEEKKKALKDEQDRVRREEARLNFKPENSADSQSKAEKQRQEEMKRHEVERKRAEKAANALKKKLLQEQQRAAKLEARRLERVRKEAEKRAKAEERAKQQQRAHEEARKQAQENARQYHYPSAPQRWPSYTHRPLTYQEYEESWNVMKLERKGSTLGYADIPWPPSGNPLFIESGDSLDVQRRKLRIALLRWHPDKFMALCGERLGSIDRESIETQAKHLAQQVIQWKSRLEQA